MDNRFFIAGFRELKDSFVKLVESISALRALSGIRVTGQDEQALIDGVLESLVQNQDLECCSVFLLREDGLLVNAGGLNWDDLIAGGSGASQGRRNGRVFRVGEGVIGRAVETGELQHCRDCTADSRFDMEGATVGVGALISVPIRNDDEVIGVLNVSHPHPGFFNDSHERTLAIFCRFLGQMLFNNRLLHKMDELVHLRTRQLEQALVEARELKRRYEALAIIDDLTELKNRRFFFPEARSTLSQAVRHGHPLSLMLLDIDHFKAVNDHYGHAVGDEVLKGVAMELQALIREGDILARFGGEEFALLLPQTEIEGATALAERIRERLSRQRWQLNGHHIAVTISCGITHLDGREEADTPALLDTLLQEADSALYQSKQDGRDRSCVFSGDV